MATFDLFGAAGGRVLGDRPAGRRRWSGSVIMAETLPRTLAPALLGNTSRRARCCRRPITILGPISGAHLNPARDPCLGAAAATPAREGCCLCRGPGRSVRSPARSLPTACSTIRCSPCLRGPDRRERMAIRGRRDLRARETILVRHSFRLSGRCRRSSASTSRPPIGSRHRRRCQSGGVDRPVLHRHVLRHQAARMSRLHPRRNRSAHSPPWRSYRGSLSPEHRTVAMDPEARL